MSLLRNVITISITHFQSEKCYRKFRVIMKSQVVVNFDYSVLGIFSCMNNALKTLVYKFYVENALYSDFERFPLIFGRWIRIRSPFLAVWFEFCTVASFAFLRVKIYIFELFSKFIIFKNLSFFNMKRKWNLEQFAKKNHRNRTNGSRDIAPRSGKIIEISRFFSKFFLFSP